MIAKWQRIVDLLARVINVPTGVITRLHPQEREFEILISSSNPENPYSVGGAYDLDAGYYCGEVIDNRQMKIIEDAHADPIWANGIEAKMGAISYLGCPLVWPDGEVFGVLCVVDTQANTYSETFQELMWQFKYAIDADLRIVIEADRQAHIEAALRENRQLLDAVISSSQSGIMAFRSVRDDAGEIVDFEWLLANPTAGQIVGRDVQHLIGHRLLVEMPGNRDEGLFKLYVQVVETGKILDHEHYYEHEGIRKWFRTTAVKMGDGFSVTFVDITKNKEAEQRLIEQNRFIEQVTDTAPYAIYVYDLVEERNVFANRYATQVMGMTKEKIKKEATAKEIQSRYHPEDKDIWMRFIKDVRQLKGNEVVSAEFRMRLMGDQDARWHWMRFWVTPFKYGPNGEVHQTLGMVLDVNDQKFAQQQAMNFALQQEKIRIMSDFIRDVSHEFRTPLSGINVATYLLRKRRDPEHIDEYTRRVEEHSRELMRLVETLLTMSRLDSESELPFDRVDINETVDKLVQNMADDAREKGVSIRQNLDSGFPDAVANMHYILTALEKVLDNAIRHTPEGGTITLSTRADDDEIIIEVRDTGEGIPPDIMPHIFDRFYRGDTAHSTRGFGLGLAIVKRIIDMHEGEIAVQSEFGKGACFTIKLPALL
jgi:PAS domain S-box-containing protein